MHVSFVYLPFDIYRTCIDSSFFFFFFLKTEAAILHKYVCIIIIIIMITFVILITETNSSHLQPGSQTKKFHSVDFAYA